MDLQVGAKEQRNNAPSCLNTFLQPPNQILSVIATKSCITNIYGNCPFNHNPHRVWIQNIRRWLWARHVPHRYDSLARALDFLRFSWQTSTMCELWFTVLLLGTWADDYPAKAPDNTQIPMYFFSQPFIRCLDFLRCWFCWQTCQKIIKDKFSILMTRRIMGKMRN